MANFGPILDFRIFHYNNVSPGLTQLNNKNEVGTIIG